MMKCQGNAISNRLMIFELFLILFQNGVRLKIFFFFFFFFLLSRNRFKRVEPSPSPLLFPQNYFPAGFHRG